MRDRARAGVDAGFSAARGPREIRDFVGWVGARPPRTRRCKELRARDPQGAGPSITAPDESASGSGLTGARNRGRAIATTTGMAQIAVAYPKRAAARPRRVPPSDEPRSMPLFQSALTLLRCALEPRAAIARYAAVCTAP